jgi:hypothetical protein
MARRLILAGLTTLLMAAQAQAQVPIREIVNLRSGLRADVVWASTVPTQGTFLWSDNASGSQEFRMLYIANNDTFNLQAVHSNQCLMLDWRGGSYPNGTAVIQYPYCGDPNYLPALWYWGHVMDGCNPAWQDCQLQQRMVLINRANHMCLDAGNAAGGVPPQYAPLQVWDCIGSINQWNAGNQLWTMAFPTSGRTR